MNLLRKRLELAVLESRLAKGEGDNDQQRAYQELEWRRCAADPVYFINRYGYLLEKDGSLAKWHLWPIQEMLLLKWANGIPTVNIKARQLGITTLQSHFFLWKAIFKEAAKCHQVSDSEAKAVDAVSRIRVTLDRLPMWLKDRASTGAVLDQSRKRDKSNAVKKIAFGFSELNVLTSTPNSVAGIAGDVGLDEFGRHKEQKRIINNVLPAADGGGLLIITGNGSGEDELYRVFNKAKHGGMGDMEAFFFWWGDDPRRLKDSYIEDDGIKTDVAEFSRTQLMKYAAEGKLHSPWYDRTREMYMRDNPESDKYDFMVQFPTTEEEAFFLSGNSRYSLETINVIKNNLRVYAEAHRPYPRKGYLEPDGKGWGFRSHTRDGNIRLYEEPVKGGEYVIGCDPAGGAADADYSVIVVWKLIRGMDVHQARAVEFGLDSLERFEPTALGVELVAVYQAKSDPDITAQQLRRLGEWYNEALIVVEREMHGMAVLGALKRDYYNIWYDRDTTKLIDDPKDNLGFRTTQNSKTDITDMMAEWMNKGWVIITDDPMLVELSRFEKKANGSLGAPKGSNDDLVMGGCFGLVGVRDCIQTTSKIRARILDPFLEV